MTMTPTVTGGQAPDGGAGLAEVIDDELVPGWPGMPGPGG